MALAFAENYVITGQREEYFFKIAVFRSSELSLWLRHRRPYWTSLRVTLFVISILTLMENFKKKENSWVAKRLNFWCSLFHRELLNLIIMTTLPNLNCFSCYYSTSLSNSLAKSCYIIRIKSLFIRVAIYVNFTIRHWCLR